MYLISRLTRFLIAIMAILLWIACTQAPALENPNKEEKHQKLPDTQKIKLTDQERAFLSAHPIIRIGTDETWEPYISRTPSGELTGFDVDILTLINNIAGTNIEIVTGKWKELVEKAKNREIDGLATSTSLESRKPYFNFSKTYVSEFPSFIIPSDDELKANTVNSHSNLPSNSLKISG